MIFKLECASLKFCVITCSWDFVTVDSKLGHKRHMKFIWSECVTILRFRLDDFDVN
jgi:hypothetical protein